jgi:predicted aspartyl protease
MGLTYVDGTVCNPTDESRSFQERFLVDTGALFSFVPRGRLAAIGIGPTRRESFRQMDGTLIERDVGRALIKVGGKEEVVPVVLAEPGDTTVLGVVALESLALGVDPVTGQLQPVTLLAVQALPPRGR